MSATQEEIGLELRGEIMQRQQVTSRSPLKILASIFDQLLSVLLETQPEAKQEALSKTIEVLTERSTA